MPIARATAILVAWLAFACVRTIQAAESAAQASKSWRPVDQSSAANATNQAIRNPDTRPGGPHGTHSACAAAGTTSDALIG